MAQEQVLLSPRGFSCSLRQGRGRGFGIRRSLERTEGSSYGRGH